MAKSPDSIRTWKNQQLLVQLFIHSKASPLHSEKQETKTLYNRLAHLYTQSEDSFYSFYLIEESTSNLLAWIHFSQIDQSLISLPKAPFGGIETLPGISDMAIQFLLECIHDYALACKLSSFSIKSPINCYLSRETRDYRELYRANGFEVSQDLVNHVIPVSATPFEAIISNSEVRRLKKCKRAAFSVTQIDQPLPEEIYDFLSQARKHKGYPLTISLETLRNLFISFPEEVLVFTVFKDDEIIALTIAVKASEDVLYNFQPATSPDYQNFSPMVLLTELLYSYCQHHNIPFLDLGTSCDHHGIQKPGLVKFKENLGCIPFRKYTFTKHY